MKRNFYMVFLSVLLICLSISVSCYAVTDADVQSAVDSSSKESVSGNLFVWFLCAIAFMKVSQKIDSFMNSLGISVGRTGGSMMGELMIAGKAIGSAFKSGGKFVGGGKGKSAVGGASPAGKTGFFGGIGRRMSDGATGAVTGNTKGSGGMVEAIGKKVYQNSVGKGGSFATGVIGSVARGEINEMGTISGANGKAAMESYFGYNANTNANANVNKKEGRSSKHRVEQGGTTTANKNSKISGTIGYNSSGQPISAPSSPPKAETPIRKVPEFSDIEMGGGRITGMENGMQFAMYDAEKYAKPEGRFETVTATDNSKWYKQYAGPSVEKTPYMSTKGKVKYRERIVAKIPKAPMRKDKM